MGFFSADLESMAELYQRETAELMEEFDARQAEAMRDNRLSAQEINAVFRVVHTIKSSAAMMGLADISGCTHRMEDLFQLFREKPERALGRESRLFDLMYQFSDYVEKENRRVAQEDFRPESADDVVRAIQKEIDFFSAESPEPEAPEAPARAEPAAPPPAAVPADAAAGAGEVVWRVTLRPNCQMENVRAFMLTRQLADLCAAVRTEPSDLEAPDAAAQIAQSGLLLTMRTAHEDEAARRLAASPYVLRVEDVGRGAGREQPEAQNAADGTRSAADDAQPGRQNKFSMVSWSHVMRLQNITGELITANTILGASIKSLAKNGELDNEFQTMKRLFHELEKLVSAVSMMPVSAAAPQYYRLVRDVAAREGKQIRLRVIGEDLEVDRSLLDTLANPLIHLLRNAADHGIETPEARAAAGKDPRGTITLKFENLTDHLRVTVEDDGCGMDRQRILQKAADRGILTRSAEQYSDEEILALAFLPGLTTNEQANQFSGRGVGMDVAQSTANSLGGSVSVGSEPGRGTTVVMEVPVSVTSAECVKFSVGPHTCLIPIRCVVHIYSMKEAEGRLQTVDGRMRLQTDEILPVLDLFGLFGVPAGESRRLIVIRASSGTAALLTGPVTGQQTAVEKPLPALLARTYRTRTGIIGCTVTETGMLGMTLNADLLIRMCGKESAENGN